MNLSMKFRWKAAAIAALMLLPSALFADHNRHVAVWRAGQEVRDLKIIDLDKRSEAHVTFPAGLFTPKTLDRAQQSFRCLAYFSPDGAHIVLDHSFNDGQRTERANIK